VVQSRVNRVSGRHMPSALSESVAFPEGVVMNEGKQTVKVQKERKYLNRRLLQGRGKAYPNHKVVLIERASMQNTKEPPALNWPGVDK